MEGIQIKDTYKNKDNYINKKDRSVQRPDFRSEEMCAAVRTESDCSSEADWEWLCSIPGIYYAHQEILLRVFRTPQGVRNATAQELMRLSEKGCGWAEKVIRFSEENQIEKTVHDRLEKGIQFISHTHTMFPNRLKTIPHCPYGLFYRGSLPPEDAAAAAIVGARMCTREGKHMAEAIAGQVAAAGGVVISGAAYGIDGAAQWAALEQGGRSYAVLGCGADISYPSSHTVLLDRLCERGGVISELPCGTMPYRSHFPMRNRLISGLSDAVAVIEAKKHSGSLITAEFAAEQGRYVMAVPGRPGDVLSEGCNELIAQGAGIVLSAESFAETVFPDYRRKRKEFSENLTLAPAEKLVYSSLDLHPKSLWEIQTGTSMSLGDLSGCLITLVQKGLARETELNYYAKMK